MPRVIITEAAIQGLERCRRFLAEKNPRVAMRAGLAIERQLMRLETGPDIGRPLDEDPELRELIIAFGGSGYVALYHHDEQSDSVYVLAFRHQKEVGYKQ